MMVVSRTELQRLTQGAPNIPDEPIASMRVSAANFDEAIERVLRLLNVGRGD
jgi:hypothetical protein